MSALDRPEEWDDGRFLFWRVLDHGEWVSIARSEIRRTKAGAMWPGSRDARYRYCREHFDWEESQQVIPASVALAWAMDRHRTTQKAGSAP